MTQESIQLTLDLHRKWLNDEEGGIRANLSGADLIRADLIRANLIGANLSGANLIRADLSGANLIRADLSGANLSGADLSGANLSGADLSGANLSGANLSGANLSGANLSGANLKEALFARIQKIKGLRERIAQQVQKEGCSLKMDQWHTCDTTHCLAGWAVTLHPQGALLEDLLGTNTAGALIFNACEGEVPDFFSSNEVAMEWLNKKPEPDTEIAQ